MGDWSQEDMRGGVVALREAKGGSWLVLLVQMGRGVWGFPRMIWEEGSTPYKVSRRGWKLYTCLEPDKLGDRIGKILIDGWEGGHYLVHKYESLSKEPAKGRQWWTGLRTWAWWCPVGGEHEARLPSTVRRIVKRAHERVTGVDVNRLPAIDEVMEEGEAIEVVDVTK